MALVLPDLLERAADLEALDAALADTGDGGRLLLVSGEAGVGKTVLLRRFCERHAGSVRILWGECDGLLTLSPLGPLVDIVGVAGGELAETVAGGGTPHAVAAALLRDLAGNVPAIVVFEDVHWADAATLDVLRLLSRRVSTVPALLVASYRDDELDRGHPLRVALGELARREATGRLRLAPLSIEAVAELAAPYGVDAAELHRRTAGNPFFVTDALAAGGLELPATVRDAVLARVAPLSPPARRLLDATAIVPGPVELPLLEALAGEAADHLEECLSCGVLGSAGTALAFRHDLARVAVEEALAPDQRLALHRRALAALAGADPARLAYHAEGADDAGAALRYGTELEPASRAALLERRSHECYTADEPREAIAELARALECHRDLGDRRSEGDALRALSRILWCPGLSEEADRAGREAVNVLEPLGPGHELAMAYANMASLGMNREDADETAAWGARALELARDQRAEAIEIHAQELDRHERVPARRPGRPRDGRAQPRAGAARRPRRGRPARLRQPDLGRAPPPRLPAGRALPARRDRVRARPRARRPVVDLPARLPRPLRARQGPLGRRRRDRCDGRPRPPRLQPADHARARRHRPAARPARRSRPVDAARRGAGARRARAPAHRAGGDRARRGGVAERRRRARDRRDRPHRRPGAAVRRALGERRGRRLAPPRRRARRPGDRSPARGDARSPGSAGPSPWPKPRRRRMSTMQEPTRRSEQQVSGWAIGAIAFAATMMVLIGVFQALAGLVAIFNDEFYVVAPNYTFDLDVSAWGWIHLLVGVAILATGMGLFARKTWAGVTAIMLCMLSALTNFFFIPYYPIWSLLVIGLNLWVIWALTRPGAIET